MQDWMTRSVSRRALITGGAATVAGGLAACGSQHDGSSAASGAATAAPSATAPSLQLVSRTRSGRVETVVTRSDALPFPVTTKVLLPVSYDSAPTRRYPVLYLLHGSTGDSGSWLAGGVEDAVGSREVILVMPDGGAQGWYLDWAQPTPIVHWESFHIRALIPAVDATYRTTATRQGRAVAGISMGGFGAVHYAQAHPELFAAVSSYSGPMSLRSPRDFVAMDSQRVDDKAAYSIFGPSPGQRAAMVEPLEHAAALRGMRVALYSGDGVTTHGPDAGEAAFSATRVAFAQRLRDAGVRCISTELPGGHEWSVWGPAFRQDLPGLLTVLAGPSERLPASARRTLLRPALIRAALA